MILEEIIDQCLVDSETWFPKYCNDIPFMALAMSGEAGEFCNVVKKHLRGSLEDVQAREKMEKELTDTFIYLMNLAGLLNMDLVESYKIIRQRNEARFGAAAKSGG